MRTGGILIPQMKKFRSRNRSDKSNSIGSYWPMPYFRLDSNWPIILSCLITNLSHENNEPQKSLYLRSRNLIPWLNIPTLLHYLCIHEHLSHQLSQDELKTLEDWRIVTRWLLVRVFVRDCFSAARFSSSGEHPRTWKKKEKSDNQSGYILSSLSLSESFYQFCNQ